MDPAFVSAAAPVPLTFEDGLGERRLVVDRGRNEPVEMLCLRGELTSVPSFEFALRERVSRLAAFRHTCYAHVRTVERLKDSGSTLALVSDATAGVRLSRLLEFAEQDNVTLDIDAALCLLRQLVPAVALLHEHAPDVCHGAIAAERVIVTPGAHVMLVEHVLGSALEQLRFPIERYWKDLRVAVPRTAGAPQFDHRADVTQVGVIALALILGRPIAADEYPSKLGEAVSSAWAMSASGGLEPLPAGLRNWLACTLQLDRKNSFESAVQAQEELERVLGESDYMAAPATLEEFLAQYRATHEPPVVPVVAAAPAPAPAPIVVTPIAVVNPPPVLPDPLKLPAVEETLRFLESREFLDRLPNLDLVGVARHFEDDRAPVFALDRRLLGDERTADDVGLFHMRRRPASGFGLSEPPSLTFDSFLSMTTKAWRTSFNSASKPVVKSTFFGLITTSAPWPGTGRVRRTASRKRRFMRLRWTAPPSARPTVNPTRRPEVAGTLAEPAVFRSR